ncbi:MAG: hypothetical protein SWX82_15665, partial [Cyanobacteriota bacterium]|nr:hypothetical protein [Cyanobacteriota bacterium]
GWGDGEMGRWGDGGMGRWGDGGMGRWGDGEMGGWGKLKSIYPHHYHAGLPNINTYRYSSMLC